MKTARLLSGFMVLATAQFAAVAQTGFTDAETAALTSFLREKFTTNVAMVIGLVDEHGPRVFSGGKSDNGANQTINGDTLFEIGSCTKTFTVLLLLDMVERGELKLDDPVAKYLPASVRLPTHGGK